MQKYNDPNLEPQYIDSSFVPGKFSKQDFELFDEEKNTPGQIVRVKRITSPTKTERWKIFANEQVVFIVEGQKLNKKEKAFLRTLDGVNFLIAEFKKGFKSLNELRQRLKKVI